MFINKSETAVAATKQTAMCNTAVAVVVVACTVAVAVAVAVAVGEQPGNWLPFLKPELASASEGQRIPDSGCFV